MCIYYSSFYVFFCCHVYYPWSISTCILTCILCVYWRGAFTWTPQHDLVQKSCSNKQPQQPWVIDVCVVMCRARKVKYRFSMFRHKLSSVSDDKSFVWLNLDSHPYDFKYWWCVCSQSDLVTWSISETKRWRKKKKDWRETKMRLK